MFYLILIVDVWCISLYFSNSRTQDPPVLLYLIKESHSLTDQNKSYTKLLNFKILKINIITVCSRTISLSTILKLNKVVLWVNQREGSEPSGVGPDAFSVSCASLIPWISAWLKAGPGVDLFLGSGTSRVKPGVFLLTRACSFPWLHDWFLDWEWGHGRFNTI